MTASKTIEDLEIGSLGSKRSLQKTTNFKAMKLTTLCAKALKWDLSADGIR